MSLPLRPTAPDVLLPLSSPEAFGRILRQHREGQGLTLTEAAARCGVSSDCLSRLERGKLGVSVERLFKVVDALGLTLLLARHADLLALHLEG